MLVDNLYKGAMGIVNVFYIDYGTRGRVPVSHLRHLPLKFTVLPAQALTANLWGECRATVDTVETFLLYFLF